MRRPALLAAAGALALGALLTFAVLLPERSAVPLMTVSQQTPGHDRQIRISFRSRRSNAT